MYEVTAELDGRFWLVRVPAVDRVTQARNIREIEPMAKELIEVMTGESNVEVQVSLKLSDAVQAHLRQLGELRVAEARARSEAAAESRRIARILRDQGLTLADVGSVLGVSHQRAAQLINT